MKDIGISGIGPHGAEQEVRRGMLLRQQKNRTRSASTRILSYRMKSPIGLVGRYCGKRKSDRKVIDGQTELIVDTIEPNDNMTVPIRSMSLIRMVFEAMEMDIPLSKFKRKQGATVSGAAVAMTARVMETRDLSINRPEDLIADDNVLVESGSSKDVEKNDLYRIGRMPGRNIDPIVRHMNRILRRRSGLRFNEVFTIGQPHISTGNPPNSSDSAIRRAIVPIGHIWPSGWPCRPTRGCP